MTALRWVGVVVLLIVCAENAKAAILPSFHLDSCAWEATHVVVVTEGDKIDGDVEVLESWKGDLKKGDLISIPALASFAPEKERVVSKGRFGRDEDPALPAAVTCSRMILFLVRTQEKAEGDKPAKTIWLPAAGKWGGMKVSTAWIEGDRVFFFAQSQNHGPQELLTRDTTEGALKKGVNAVLTAQATLTQAIRRGEGDKLAKTALVLLGSESEYVRVSVVGDLGAVGAKGLPALRAILKDDMLIKYHEGAVRALAKAAGADAGPELAEVVKQELKFWMKVGPDLPANWWNGAQGGVKWDQVEQLRNHYSLAHSAVIELGVRRHAGGREPVSEFGKYWRSLPQLFGVKQLAEACDTALKAMPR